MKLVPCLSSKKKHEVGRIRKEEEGWKKSERFCGGNQVIKNRKSIIRVGENLFFPQNKVKRNREVERGAR